MSYLNRFVVEEEGQFECEGVFGLGDSSRRSLLSFIEDLRIWRLEKRIKQLELHIFISDSLLKTTLARILRRFRSRTNLSYLMITHVGSETLECVTEEEYDNFYKEKGRIRYATNHIFCPYIVCDVRRSIGIEDFFQLIKMKKISMNPNLDLDRYFHEKDFKYRLESAVKNFHLSMLTEEKQNEISIQRNSGRKCSQFKNDINLSEK